jgi:hypothetical protein
LKKKVEKKHLVLLEKSSFLSLLKIQNIDGFDLFVKVSKTKLDRRGFDLL